MGCPTTGPVVAEPREKNPTLYEASCLRGSDPLLKNHNTVRERGSDGFLLYEKRLISFLLTTVSFACLHTFTMWAIFRDISTIPLKL